MDGSAHLFRIRVVSVHVVKSVSHSYTHNSHQLLVCSFSSDNRIKEKEQKKIWMVMNPLI